MKKKMKHILLTCTAALTLSGCIEETFPTSFATTEQVGGSSAALEALANSTAAFMNNYDLMGAGAAYDIGYAGLILFRETMLQDFVPNPNNYNYFQFYYPYAKPLYLGDTYYCYYIWYYYYTLIKNANNLIGSVDPETATAEAKQYLGCSLLYRAMAYLELAQFFEYQKTGIASLDDEAEASGIMGLTVPLSLPTTSGEESVNNPRLPFYTLYRFIMSDLNDAEEYLADYTPAAKNQPDLTVVYGIKARLWMLIASRCDRNADDLATLNLHDADPNGFDALNVGTVQQAYQQAYDYAGRAIGSHTPLTSSEWHNATTGFNSCAPSSWMFAVIISSDAVNGSWSTYTGYTSSENDFGICGQYGCYMEIDRSLYDRIGDSDWRKLSWIDPADAGQPLSSVRDKYTLNTNLTDAKWREFPAYTNLKFRSGSGNMTDYKTACAIDIPLMRVEEMYFLRIEAAAHLQGVSGGVAELESFMNSYRYSDGSYSCTATTLDDFIDEMLVQKRVEFWGEGILAFDYKRLYKQVVRGYEGSNMPAEFQYNSVEGYVAPWMNTFITSNLEANVNQGIVNNPDASTACIDLKYSK